MNHSHNHEMMLIPFWAVESKTPRSSSNPPTCSVGFASHTAAEGKICRNVNHLKGWQQANSQFAHVCNSRVASQACDKVHAGHSRFVSISQVQ